MRTVRVTSYARVTLWIELSVESCHRAIFRGIKINGTLVPKGDKKGKKGKVLVGLVVGCQKIPEQDGGTTRMKDSQNSVLGGIKSERAATKLPRPSFCFAPRASCVPRTS